MSDKRRAVKQRLRSAGEDGADPWPDEPGEFDPNSLGPDTPESLSAGRDAEEVDEQTFQAFWSAVLLANVGLFAASVGPMLAVFQGRYLLGGGMTVVGVVALARTYRIYQGFTRGSDGESSEESAERDRLEEAEP